MVTDIKLGFAIPNMYEFFDLNKEMLRILQIHPEIKRDNIEFDAFYGTFQFSIWEGGRQFQSYIQTTLDQVQEIKNYYNEQKIPIRFTYTNSQLKEEHLYDRFCNLVTKECENELNEIVVNSPLLEEYIKINFPKYKIISSTTKCIKNKEDIKKEIDNPNYSKICLDFNLNHSMNLLESFTQEQKNKIEFLINAVCGDGCEYRFQHYKLISSSNLSYCKPYKLQSCELYESNHYPQLNLKNQITINDIINIYAPLGFKHFKIEGRARPPISHIISCANYIIKPEYKDYFIEQLVNFLLKDENNG